MKKLISLTLILIIGNISLYAQFDRLPNNVFTGSLPQSKLTFLKKYYKWNEGTRLLVRFTTYKRTCHYNQYPIGRSKSKVEEVTNPLYKDLPIQDISIAHIFLEKKLSKQFILNRSDYYQDYEDFFSKTLSLKKRKYCYAVVLIDENGNMAGRIGEYTNADLKEFIIYLNEKDEHQKK